MNLKNLEVLAKTLGALGLGAVATKYAKSNNQKNNNFGYQQNPLMKQIVKQSQQNIQESIKPLKRNNIRKQNVTQQVRRTNNNQKCIEAPTNICQPVQMCSNGSGNVKLSNRELITQVYGSAGPFTAVGLEINPGLSSTFSWLSLIAQNYEFYKFNNLTFEYVPMVGTQTPGYVSMAFDSDVLDALPLNKQDMSTYSKFNNVSSWTPSNFQVPASMMNKFVKNHFVRNSTIPQGADAKTYDVGQFIVATGGQGSTALLGELYVCYSVTLEQPCSNGADEDNQSLLLRGVPQSLVGQQIFGQNVYDVRIGDLSYDFNTPNFLTLKEPGYFLLTLYLASGVALGSISITTGGTLTSTLIQQVWNTADTVKMMQYKISTQNLFGDSIAAYLANNVALNAINVTICKINQKVYSNL